MVETILSSPLFIEAILPFLLVFTVVFAVLQKTQILGKDKKQIDALVALVFGLIVISFGYATGVIVSLIPVLAVSATVILIFMLLYGMTHSDGGKPFDLPGRAKGVIGALAAIVVVIAVLVATGSWDYLLNRFFYGGDNSNLITNITFIVIIIVAVGATVFSGSKGSDDKKKDH